MRGLLAGVCCLGLLISGCGGSSNRPVTDDERKATTLGDVGEIYRLYTAEKKKPPTKIEDLTPLQRLCPMGLRAIETGEVIVRFGAVLPDTGEGPGSGTAEEVLAFEKEVPDAGGQVLMLNRTVRSMTSDEFKVAKLAGTASSAALPPRGAGRNK